MQLSEVVETRRSIKKYDTNHKMTESEINSIIDTAMLAPTSFNIQHWRFCVIDDASIRQEIRDNAWGQAQITDASVLIIVCADLKAWEKDTARYWKNASEEVRNVLLPMIDGFYTGRDQMQSDEGMRSGGMAAQNIMLKAREIGYDTCPMISFDRDAVAKIINLPNDHEIVMMIAVGKQLEPAKPRGGQLSREEVMIHNKF